MNASQLQWGLKDKDIVSDALWGARCILNSWTEKVRRTRKGKVFIEGVSRRALDILWDRQGVQGDTPELAEEFSKFLNAGPIDLLRKAVDKGTVGYGGERVQVVVLGGVQFHTQESYGYLYVTARRVLSEIIGP